MATTTENISIKIGLDTSQFNSSVKGMLNELKALQKVDLTILTEADKKAVVSRMGDLRDGIANIKKEINNADPSAFFQSFTTLAGPAIAAISGIAVGMELFGAKTEEVDAVQRKLMGVISLLSTLQTVADANKLKGILSQIPLQAAELKNRIVNTLLIKQETAAVVTENVAKVTLGKTTGLLTKLQLMWNAAVMANPVGIIIAAVAALAGGIYLLSKAMKDNVAVQKEVYTAMDGSIKQSKELMDIQNQMIISRQKFGVEYLKLNNTIGDSEYQLMKNDIQFTEERTKEDNNYLENKKKIEKELSETIYDGTSRSEEERRKIVDDAQLKQEENLRQHNLNIFNLNEKYRLDNATAQDSYLTKTTKMTQDNILATTKNQEKLLNSQYVNELEVAQKEFGGLKTRYEERYKLLETSLSKEEDITKATQIINEQTTLSNEYIGKYNAYLLLIESIEKKYGYQRNDIRKKQEQELWADTQKFFDDFVNENKAKQKELDKLWADTLKEFEDMQKENQEFRIQNGLDTNETIMNNEITALEKTLPYYVATEEEKQKARQNIIDKYTAIELDKEKNKLDYLSSIGIDVQKQQQDLELNQLQDALNKKLITEEQFQIAKQAMIDKYDVARDEKQKVINEAIAAGFQILTDNIAANEEQDLENLQNYNDQKTQSIDDQLAAGLMSEKRAAIEKENLAKEIAAREKAIKIKAAREAKLIAVFQIAIDTLVAVMKSLATLGPIAGAAVTPFIIASGAISAASVMAKPIPAYAKGTKNAQGGMSIVGEKGPELLNIPKGSEVVSNKDLSSLLNNNNSISFEMMKAYVDQSFVRYSQIPVVVSEYNITQTQNKVRNVQVNSEVM